MKKVFILILLIMLTVLLVLTGCSGFDAFTTMKQRGEAELQELLVLAPDIEGTEKVIKEISGLKRVTYERDGVYIGEYKKEVTQTDENGEATEVGGIALIGSEAERILNEQLPTAKNGYLMPLSADISDLTTLENVNLVINSEGAMVEGPYFINISFGSETIDVCNVMPDLTSIHQIYADKIDMVTSISLFNWQGCVDPIIVGGTEMQYVYILAYFQNGEIIADSLTLPMGGLLGKTNKPILQSVNAYGSSAVPIQSFDNILMTQGVPVFVISE